MVGWYPARRGSAGGGPRTAGVTGAAAPELEAPSSRALVLRSKVFLNQNETKLVDQNLTPHLVEKLNFTKKRGKLSGVSKAE